MRHLIALALAVTVSTHAAAQDVSDPMSWAEDFMQKLVSDGATVCARTNQAILSRTRQA